MKILTITKLKRSILKSVFAFLLCSFTLTAFATHFRYGNISWSVDAVNPRKIHFKVTEAWRRGFNWTQYSGSNVLNPVTGNVINFANNFPFNFGDGTSAQILLTITSFSSTDDWIFGEFNVDHTYSSNNNFLAFFEGAARLSGPPTTLNGLLQNNGDASFRVESRVTVGNNNNAPVSTLPPVLNMVVNQAAAHYQIPATDPDGDVLTFTLAPSASFTQTGTAPNIQPPGLSVSPGGLISFNTVGKTIGHFYNAVIRITDDAGAYVHLDVLIKITGPSSPPVWDYTVTPLNNFSYSLAPGTPVNFTVKAKDIDPADNVTLFVNGFPIGASMTPSLPFSGPINAPVQSTFNWTPTLAQVGNFVTTFIAQDPQGVQTPTTVTFKVQCNTDFTATHTDEDCNVQGSITIEVTNGTAPFVFSKDGGATYVSGTSPFTFDHLPAGTYHLAVKGANGCIATHDETVNKIPDTEPPTFTFCFVGYGDITNDPGICGAVIQYPLPTAVDNCPTPVSITLTSGLPSGSVFPVGTTLVTYTATDGSGNTSTCSFPVTVTDREPPSVTCNPDITHNTDQGVCSYSFLPDKPFAADNCGNVIVDGARSDFMPLNAPYPVGTTTIIWTATDASGNSNICVQRINIVDKELPVVICPNDITVPTDPGRCDARVQEGVPQVSDNCDVHELLGNRSDGHALGEPYPVGTTTVIWTATDIHGNINTCEQKITVTDTERPVIHCPAPVIVANDPGQCGATVTLAPEVSDNCGIQSISGPTTGFYPLGTTSVTFSATDIHGNVSSCLTTVTVLDKEPPTITCAPDVTHSTDQGVCSYSFLPDKPSATDNCTGVTVTGARSDGQPLNAPYLVGTTTIDWTATDFSGNTSTCSQKITITDNELPVIVCPNDLSVPNDPGKCEANVQTGVPNASDNCGIDAVSGSRSDGKMIGDSYPVGTTTIVWTATDIHGNSKSCEQKIIVVDVERPVIICPAPVIVANDPGKCGATVTLGQPSASDNCGVQSVNGPTTGFYPLGTTSVTFSATDINGNVSSCLTTVTVLDKELPVLKCPAIPVLCQNANNTYSIPPLQATDNCGPVSIHYTISGATTRSGNGANASGLFNPGTSVLTFTVMDQSGNVATCTVKVDVSSLTVNIPDAYAAPSGVQPNTVYPGYGPASSITLTANPVGGFGPFTFVWSTGSTGQNVTVSPVVPTTYTVSVTDATGCIGHASKLVQVIDVHCGNNNDKVLVCQVPQGNTENAHTICVSANAVPALLVNGSYLGACVPATVNVVAKTTKPETVPAKSLELGAFPNPSTGDFILNINSSKKDKIQLLVYNVLGNVIEKKTVFVNQNYKIGSLYTPGIYFAELTQGKESVRIKLVKQ